MIVGSLCSGYEGIGLGIGGDLAYVCDPEPAAARLLAVDWPNVPNMHDLKSLEWADTPVDVLTAGYPCFTAGTPVLTRDGYLPIEQVEVGTLVLTHKGRWRPVTSLMRKANAPTVVVSAQGTHEVTCTPEHPWWTEQGEWIDAAELKGRRVVQVVPQQEPDAKHLDPALLWVLGRHLADGYCQARKGRDSGRVTIVGAHEEADALGERISAAGLGGYRNVERTVTRFAITRTSFYDLARMCGTGAAHKRVPGWLLASLTPEGADALLDGYLTGDGCRDRRQGGWTATTVSPALAYGMALVAQIARGVVCSVRLNRVPATTVIEGRTVNQRPFYKLTVPARNRSGRIEGDRALKLVRRVEPGPASTVYNIAVDEDESYVVANAVVHNCQPFSQAGKRRGTDDPRHLWPHIAAGIARSRPPLCLFENVRGHLNLGFDTVLLDLHRLGYDVRWTLLRAADVGAPHSRARLFIVAADRDVHGWEPSSRIPERVAGPDGWETPDAGLFGAVPVTVTPPPAGRMVGGVVWDEPPLLGTVLYDLLPTPEASDGTGGRVSAERGGVRPSGAKRAVTLATAVAHDLLPTPRATDGTKGGPNQAGSSGDLMLPSAVMPHNLLPTPRTSDTNGAGAHGDGGLDLRTAVTLLPTPAARDWKGTGPSDANRNSPSMAAIGDLLPTPTAMDAHASGGGYDGQTNVTLTDATVRQPDKWGRYAAAVARCETLTRPAPPPTEPTGRGGAQRLSPAFVEWMMMLPAGHVTGHGLTRNEQLKLLGNGVVPAQAAAAWQHLTADLTRRSAAA